MSKKILELSISLFLIVSSVCIIILMFTVNSTLNYYVETTEAQIQNEEKIIRSANGVREMMLEAGIVFAIRALEEENMIPPSEAEKMVLQSIETIEKHSERLGKIAKYVNEHRRQSGK